MKELSVPTKIYLISIYLAGLGLFIWNIRFTSAGNFWQVAVLSLLASFFQVLRVEGATNRSHYTFSFPDLWFGIFRNSASRRNHDRDLDFKHSGMDMDPATLVYPIIQHIQLFYCHVRGLPCLDAGKRLRITFHARQGCCLWRWV